MRKFVKKFKNSILGKILKFIFNILLKLFEIFIIIIALIIVVQRVTNNQESFLGYRIFNVATGSMEPEYVVGDILISKEKEPSKIEVGDNIVYLGKKGDYKGKIITHAVIEVERDEKGDYLFHTKGIANTVEDPVVHEDQLYGTIVNNNVVLAYICKILTNKYGLYFFVMVPIILYAFVSFVKAQGRKIEEERREEAEEKERQKKLEEQQKENKKLTQEQEKVADNKEQIDQDTKMLENNKKKLEKKVSSSEEEK